MDEALKPIMITKTDDDIKERKTFEKEGFKIDIEKSQIDEKIVIRIICPNGLNLMEKKYSYNQLMNLVKPLRVNENINDLYSNLIELFNNNEDTLNFIEEKDIIELSINLYNNKGIKENYSLEIEEIEQDVKTFQKIIFKKILELEKENKKLSEENKKLNENNKKLNEEMKQMKKEIEKIKKLSFSDNIENNNNNNKITFYSKIINNINEFQFVLNKIEKLSSKEIKSLQLLYRASEYSYSG